MRSIIEQTHGNIESVFKLTMTEANPVKHGSSQEDCFFYYEETCTVHMYLYCLT